MCVVYVFAGMCLCVLGCVCGCLCMGPCFLCVCELCVGVCGVCVGTCAYVVVCIDVFVGLAFCVCV